MTGPHSQGKPQLGGFGRDGRRTSTQLGRDLYDGKRPSQALEFGDIVSTPQASGVHRDSPTQKAAQIASLEIVPISCRTLPTNCAGVAIYRRAMCHPPFKISSSG